MEEHFGRVHSIYTELRTKNAIKDRLEEKRRREK